jgi:hypothetical protein
VIFDPEFGVLYQYAILSGPNIMEISIPAGLGYEGAYFEVFIGDLSFTLLQGDALDVTAIGYPNGIRNFQLTGSGMRDSYLFGLRLANSNPLGLYQGFIERYVDIDIKPSSNRNSINIESRGVIPVTILTTDTFDATTVDPLSVAFGPSGADEAHGRYHVEDVDGDGDWDLVLHFRTKETGIACGDATAKLAGMTIDGQAVKGQDSIEIVGCR